MTHPTLVDHNDWLLATRLKGEQTIRMLLLDADVQSAQFALGDYASAGEEMASYTGSGAHTEALARSIHSAKVFVSSMRRVGRLLESLSTNRTIFPSEIADAIRLVWRKHRAFFLAYVDPRNAIEHIDGEIEDRTNWVLLNLLGDSLQVSPGKAAPVTFEALQVAVSARNEVATALRQHLPG